MRVPVLLSVLLHAGVVAVGMIALPRTVKPPVELPPVLTFEGLVVAEETNILPVVDTDTDEPPVPSARPEPQPRPDPVPQPEPEPEPEAPPVRPEPAPAPAAPAPDPEPAPRPFEEPQRTPVEAAPEPPPTPTETLARAVPRSRPQPTPAPSAQDGEGDFLAGLSDALKDLKPEEGPGRSLHQLSNDAREAAANQRHAAAGLQTELTVSEIDAIRAQLQPCWSPPAGAPNAGELIVILRVRFNPDGTVIGAPSVVRPRRGMGDKYLQTAADRAVRAVLACQPFRLPVETYAMWATVELEFDPRFLLGP